jgi:hypothetical protein
MATPPPSPPFPPRSSFVFVPILEARSSSLFSVGFPASRCVDHQMHTMCVTALLKRGHNSDVLKARRSRRCATQRESTGPWVAVRVANNTPVFTVVLHVARPYAALLVEYAVWLGDSPGDTTSAAAHLCGRGGVVHGASPLPLVHVESCARARGGHSAYTPAIFSWLTTASVHSSCYVTCTRRSHCSAALHSVYATGAPGTQHVRG